MKLPERITLDPEIMMGKPCVKGTRIPVYVLLQKMAAGETEAESNTNNHAGLKITLPGAAQRYDAQRQEVQRLVG
jgi:uncharacterized protein (DUF433 family)